MNVTLANLSPACQVAVTECIRDLCCQRHVAVTVVVVLNSGTSAPTLSVNDIKLGERNFTYELLGLARDAFNKSSRTQGLRPATSVVMAFVPNTDGCPTEPAVVPEGWMPTKHP